MAAYEVLLLNTAIPQIQAAQSGDTYVVPRDIAINATAIISANSATDALRITQTGAGNALVVEDSSNPDATPFVVSAAGDVGIGTNAPGTKLDVVGVITSRSDTFAAVRFKSAAGTDKAFLSYEDGATSVILNNYGSGPIIFKTADTERARITSTGEFQWKPNGSTQAMTLDASGNLGVGTTSPGFRLDVTAARATSRLTSSTGTNAVDVQANNTGGQLLLGIDNSAGSSLFGAGGYTAGLWYSGAYPLTFGTSNTERARITSGGDFRVKGAGTAGSTEAFQVSGSAPADAARLTSGGSLCVGRTTAYSANVERLSVEATGNSPAVLAINAAGATEPTYVAWNSATSGDNAFVTFYTEATVTLRGSITYNRGGGVVAYNTTSDYRAKDILGPVTDTGATIDALKVYNGKMKGATIERPMLIAHEAQTVTPYAVTGEKDAVDKDGKPKYQQMDVSSLVPLLIAEIQSLRARVAQLEAK